MVQRFVGLDIGTHAVRAVELTVNGKDRKVTKFGQVALPSGAVIDGEVDDPGAVADAISRLWSQVGFPKQGIVVGLSGQRVLVRQAELPAMEEEELRAALSLESQELIPIPVDDAIIDFCVLDRFHNGDGDELMRVLLAAAPRTVVNRHLEAVSRAGLHVSSIDVASLGLLRCVAGDLEVRDWLPGAEVLVSVGSDLTTVIVHEHGILRFSRTLKVGGNTVTDVLADAFGVEAAKAESIKRMADPNSPDDLARAAAEVIRSRIGVLASEIVSSLDYYLAQADSSRIVRVLLTGGGSQTPFLAERVEKLVGCEVQLVRSLARIHADHAKFDTEETAKFEQLVTLPLGLAMGALPVVDKSRKPISLLPHDVAAKRGERRQLILMGGAISFLLVGLMIAWFLRGLELDSAQKDLSSAITRNAIAQTQLSQFNDVQTNNVGLAKSTQIVRQALTGDIDQGQLLRQIGSVMPQDVYLRAISINRGEGKKATTIVITAVGRTQTSPGNLVTALRDVPALTGVWIGNSSLDSTAGSGGTRFDVTAQLTSASLSDRVARILGTPK